MGQIAVALLSPEDQAALARGREILLSENRRAYETFERADPRSIAPGQHEHPQNRPLNKIPTIPSKFNLLTPKRVMALAEGSL